MVKEKYEMIERKNARVKTRRVWDTFDPNGMGVLEIVATDKGICVYDGDGNILGHVPLGNTRASYDTEKV